MPAYAELEGAQENLLPENVVESPYLEPNHTSQETLEGDQDVTHGGEHDAPSGEAHKKAGLPQFDPASFTSQIFWLLVTFAILYLFFSRQTLPAIAAIQKKRRAHIEHDLLTAQQLRANAEEAKARYERVVAEAQKTSTSLFLKSEEESKAKINAGIEEFRNRAIMQLKQTEEVIENAKTRAIDGIHTAVAEIAATAAEKIVGISTDIDEAKSVIKNMNKKAA